MAKCGCGKCLHLNLVEQVETDPESRSSFLRKTCEDCGQWLGDKSLPIVDKSKR